MAELIIRTFNLVREYRMGGAVVRALDGLTLEVGRGAFFGVVGRSGSGKSTLLNLLGGLDTPTSGTIEVAGVALSTAGADALAAYRRDKVGFIFQQFNLVSSMTAQENVELPLVFAGVSPGKRRERAVELLEKVGLAARRGHRPMEMSGGEQQRVAIARALANRPSLLLADEPTGNLDSATAVEVMELLKKMNAEGETIALVTHERSLADQYCARIVELRDGKVLFDSAAAPAGKP